MKCSFPIQVLLILVVSILFTVYPLNDWTNERVSFAAQIGILIMSLNAMFGYWTIQKAYHKSNNIFLKYVFGGMFIRLLVLALFLLLLIKVFHIDILALITIMFLYYFVFMILEIIYVQKKLAK
ncbi:MAG: hypothetical protein FJ218_09155 [Ignavibacteria bacterium]|nr:hypothetical protein [Ignavibacteria bacterium]